MEPMISAEHVVSRRAFAAATALLGAGCDRVLSAVAGLAGDDIPASFSVPDREHTDEGVHLLSRATFGPRPGDLDAMRSMGQAAWLEQQLSPATIDDLACDLRAGAIDVPHLDAGSVFELPPEQIEVELSRHALLRAVYSRRQLLEVMTELWGDHFHVAIGKDACRHLRAPYDREVIRAHALGRFRDLLAAATTSSAMLVYLDGAGNEVSDHPNENHARELLELHTLGADAGYTQEDVREVARCLTGFVLEREGRRPGSVSFIADKHDDGSKLVLGHRIGRGGSRSDVDRVLDILSAHPATARRIATKVARTFVADDPPEDLVTSAAATFTTTGGDLAAVARSVLSSDAFRESAGRKIKRPFRLVVSALRSLGTDTHCRGSVLDALGRMGHAPYAWPSPDGYPDRGDAWLGTIGARFRFASELANAKLSGADVRIDRLCRAAGGELAVASHILGRSPTEAERAALDRAADPASKVALALSSPAFQMF
jgi:uncharacterized protein (DUF1800 family)